MHEEGNMLPVPGPGMAYRTGWQIMKKYFLELLLIVILQGLFSTPIWYYSRYIDYTDNFDFVSYIFWLAYTFLVYLPLNYGMFNAFLLAVRNEKVRATDIFKAHRNFWNTVLANILVNTIVGLGFALLVIPGLIFLARLSFVPYYIVDKQMEVFDAIKLSWFSTKNYTARIVSILLLAVPILALGVIILGFGSIISLMWICTTVAFFYHTIDFNSKNISDNDEQP